ncbi:esterase-like activity of phytase family protein [Nitratifractor sp.]|uniref:esterase-like activity of phytase family protein n=1 Tax=Nitratifractor sp. TaxID=2268144 RepID=UPI0025D37147|nr:esterase-like activity of phytase family protein [Nitratifractor sp.]
MGRSLFLLFLLFSVLRAEVYSVDIRPSGWKGDRVGALQILDQKELVFDQIGGRHFAEISDLAFLKKRRWLFMISDEGKLFRFQARFGEKIRELSPLDAATLRKKSGKKLKKWRRDSEGLTLDGKGRLYVSFEEKPRIAQVGYDGRIVRYLRLPKAIDSMGKFRSKNKGLEALAWHPKYGLVTAAEYPVKAHSKKIQTLYALRGRQWSFLRGKEPKSAVTALGVLDNGNFLVLERSITGVLDPVVITLREVKIDHCRQGLCPTKILARLDSSKGWTVDNFEGLAKVGPNRFVTVSDDNDNFYQKTLLIYFQVLPGK